MHDNFYFSFDFNYFTGQHCAVLAGVAADSNLSERVTGSDLLCVLVHVKKDMDQKTGASGFLS